MRIEALSGVEAAEQYKHMFHVEQVFILRDQLNCECYHCTTDRVEIERIKLQQALNKNEVRVL